LQHLGLIEALHAEIADTEAAFAQLQQESLGHADLLASHSDQVIHHASLLMTVSACYSLACAIMPWPRFA